MFPLAVLPSKNRAKLKPVHIVTRIGDWQQGRVRKLYPLFAAGNFLPV
jgi:hypothetical protein